MEMRWGVGGDVCPHQAVLERWLGGSSTNSRSTKKPVKKISILLLTLPSPFSLPYIFKQFPHPSHPRHHSPMQIESSFKWTLHSSLMVITRSNSTTTNTAHISTSFLPLNHGHNQSIFASHYHTWPRNCPRSVQAGRSNLLLIPTAFSTPTTTPPPHPTTIHHSTIHLCHYHHPRIPTMFNIMPRVKSIAGPEWGWFGMGWRSIDHFGLAQPQPPQQQPETSVFPGIWIQVGSWFGFIPKGRFGCRVCEWGWMRLWYAALNPWQIFSLRLQSMVLTTGTRYSASGQFDPISLHRQHCVLG